VVKTNADLHCEKSIIIRSRRAGALPESHLLFPDLTFFIYILGIL
jgi:hypothetical protein